MIVSKVLNRIRRLINKRKLYIYPETSCEWVKSNKALINSELSSYFDPYSCVVNGKIKIYISRRNDNTIVSFDFVNEELVNEQVALFPSASGWDSRINRACVLFYNDNYYMWYTGQNSGKSMIGIAISEDGINFKRLTNKPIIEPQLPFEKDSVMNPYVLFDESSKTFKMWYSAGETYEPDVICFAESEDGINWVKKEKPVLLKSNNEYDKYKVGGCDIIKTERGFTMFYIGYQNLDNARICMAESKDGINWTRIMHNPIISPTKGSYDAHACYKPCYINDIINKKEYIIYNGRVNGDESIGYTVRNLYERKNYNE